MVVAQLYKQGKELLKSSYLTERLPLHSVNNDSQNSWLERFQEHEELFIHRLHEDGINVDAFVTMTRDPENILLKGTLSWLSTFETIFSTDRDLGEFDHDIPYDNINYLLLPFVKPFLSYSKEMFQRKLTYHENKININLSKVTSSLLQRILKELINLSIKTIIHELHESREKRNLLGDTSADRFQYFVEKKLTTKNDIINILLRYPLLARLMTEKMEQLINVFHEAIFRYINDYNYIKDRFGEMGTLDEIVSNLGDSHHEGRSVMIFQFESTKRLVYKPRSLSTDVHFQELLSWVNSKNISYPFKILNILDKDTHGWIEFITPDPCESIEQLRHFYVRQGYNLALLYVLGATDFHYENIIASGEYPILIDLEGLLQNSFNLQTRSDSTALAIKELSDSVFTSGMLPVNYLPNQMNNDISGIGSEAELELNQLIPTILDMGTDVMRFDSLKAVLVGSNNLPIYNGKQINAIEYKIEIIDGFKEMYDLLVLYKKEYNENHPFFQFKSDRIRVILRNTQTYAQLLAESTHPDYLKNGLERNELFDFLWFMAADFKPYQYLVNSECLDLLQQDVPIFFADVNDTVIYDSRNNILNSKFEESSFTKLLRKIEMLSIEDRNKQISYIQISLSSLSKKNNVPKGNYPNQNPILSNKYVDESIFLEQAEKIAGKLQNTAIYGEDKSDVTWIGVNCDMEEKLSASPLDNGIYNGISGIGLFFSLMAKETEKESYNTITYQIISKIRSDLANRIVPNNLSAFYGTPSIAYTFGFIGSLFNDKTLISEAEEILLQSEKLIQHDPIFDLMGGVAGYLLICLRLYKKTNNTKLLKIAQTCGDHLLANMLEDESRTGWLFNRTSKILSGLSHGNAGIAWSLVELYSITNDNKYLYPALKALSYENTMYDHSEKNWIDIRFDQKSDHNPVNWCHGAAGIGIGRVNIYKHIKLPFLLKDIEVAVDTTLKRGFGDSHSLCHGDFGNLDFLLNAAPTIDEHLLLKSRQLANEIINEKKKHWLSGVPGNFETPGFMLGLSGTAYGLLRLWNPKIPSVLNFDLPD